MATAAQQAAPTERGQRKTRVGLVTSNKMQKTIVVRVQELTRHPKYNRVVKQTGSFKAHDEKNEAAIGDWVKIMETRPLSKDKRWRLVEIVKRASTAPPVPGTEADEARRARPAAKEKPSGHADETAA